MANLKSIQDGIVNSQIWKSVFRVGIPNTNRKRVLAVLGSLILHLHPVKVRRSGVRMSYTWCMGGTSFFLFLVETVKIGRASCRERVEMAGGGGSVKRKARVRKTDCEGSE